MSKPIDAYTLVALGEPPTMLFSTTVLPDVARSEITPYEVSLPSRRNTTLPATSVSVAVSSQIRASLSGAA